MRLKEALASCGRTCLLFAFAILAGKAALGGEVPHVLEPPDTSSPRATLHSFIDGVNAAYQFAKTEGRGQVIEAEAVRERVLRCLDLSEVPGFARTNVGKEAAVCLKEVLDRIELPPDEEIPGKEIPTQDESEKLIPGAVSPGAARPGVMIPGMPIPGKAVPDEEESDEEKADGDKGDGESAPAPLPDRWRIPHTEITIAKVKEGPYAGEYLFSPYTIEHAKEFYDRIKHLPYKPGATEGFYEWYLTEPGSALLAKLVHSLPAGAHTRVYGQAVWQWSGLFLSVGLGLVVMLIAYLFGRWQARHTRRSNTLYYFLTLAFPIAAMLVPLVVRNFVTAELVISGTTLTVVDFSANVVFLLAVMVVLVSAGSRIAEVIIASPRIHPQGLDAQLVRLSCRVLSIGAALVVFLEGGRYLGIPLTTLLAGAGVGGLTVALAAQDTLKNLFGSMMIILDKPYKVGERIVAKGYDGVVEEIGLRSTKLRLLTGHVASIPNEDMARSDVENIGRRPHIRRIADLRIPLDTPREKLEKAVATIRKILENHEGMDPEFPPRVYFNEFNPGSFNIRVIYWYSPPLYWDFLALSERVNVEICRTFEEQGIPFSLPTRLTHVDMAGREPFPFRPVK